MSFESDLRIFISKNFAPDVPADEIPTEYDLVGSGILTSLALVRLIAWLGNNYGVPINELDLTPDYFRSVDSICAFVAENSVPARV